MSEDEKWAPMKIITIVIALTSMIFLFFLLILNLCYIALKFKRFTLLWFPHLIVMVFLFLFSLVTIFHEIHTYKYDNPIEFSVFISMNIKLIINLIISQVKLSTRKRRVSLFLKNKFLNHTILIFSVFLTGGLIVLGFKFYSQTDQKQLFNDEIWEYLICVFLILINFFILFMLVRKSKINFKIGIFLKVNLLDCLGCIMMICIFWLNNFEVVILCGLILISVYSFIQTRLLLKYDFSDYYEEFQKKNNIGFIIEKVFFLEKFIDEFSEYNIPFFQKAHKIRVSGDAAEFKLSKVLVYDKSREYLYFNFCILSEIYKFQLSLNENHILRSFESASSYVEEMSNPKTMDFSLKELLDLYYSCNLEDGDINMTSNKFRSFFPNVKLEDQIVLVTSHQKENFQQLNNNLNINIISIVEALNPKKNSKICKNLEAKLDLNSAYNEFYSYDCLITFEIYEFTIIEQIESTLREYFCYMKEHKTSFQKTYFPLIIGCFSIKYLDQQYVIVINRNPYAFSTFHEMRHYFIMSIDGNEKKVTLTSNPKYKSNFVGSNEIEIMNDIFLQDDDFLTFKLNLLSDLNFLVRRRIKYSLNVFIINDYFNNEMDSVRSYNDRVSARFDFSIIDKISENESNLKVMTSSLSNFEELFIIKYNRKSRYIIKTYFSNIFSYLDEDVDSHYYRSMYFIVKIGLRTILCLQ